MAATSEIELDFCIGFSKKSCPQPVPLPSPTHGEEANQTLKSWNQPHISAEIDFHSGPIALILTRSAKRFLTFTIEYGT